ncbi:MAG TPA: DUF1559 domain-containing protein [Planctomycetaceae bacterium]|jgi:prepilin-type N-terminal cleavage/methylation domain-containing protein|nr:DUF1559 domain-containing protein [Planctomycetaceae bacterium]
MFARTSNGSGMASSSPRGFTVIELLVVLCVIAVLIGFLLPPVTRSARPAARRVQCRNNLRQIGLALHNYHDAWGTFPPAYTVDADGKRLHSWRTLLLPYVDQQALYARIDLTKPWDDPANAEAFKKPVTCYACPSHMDYPAKTSYLAVVTPHSVLREGSSCSLHDINDGTANTLVVLEVRAEHAVPWMAPQDADEAMVATFRKSTSKHNHVGGGHALLADGAARFLSESISEAVLFGLTTADGGEKLDDF